MAVTMKTGGSKREKILIIAAGMAIMFLVPYNLVIKPSLDKVNAAKKVISDSRKKLVELETLEKNIQAKKKAVEEERFKEPVYFRDFTDVLNYFGRLARMFSIDIITMTPSNTQIKAGAEGSAAQKTVTVQLAMRGRYQSFVDFFRLVGKERHAVRFDALDVRPEREESGAKALSAPSVLLVTATIKTFYE
jgi:hypothetical protein